MFCTFRCNLQCIFICRYEKYGAEDKFKRVHHDPDFPRVLIPFFPRIYLPEYSLYPNYEVIEVCNIISPAPLSVDVTVMHYSPADEADAREEQGSAASAAQRRQMRQQTLQTEPLLNLPYLPTKFICPRPDCQQQGCTMLHKDQFLGGDVDKTILYTCNLLAFEMSRGVWNPLWQNNGNSSAVSHEDAEDPDDEADDVEEQVLWCYPPLMPICHFVTCNHDICSGHPSGCRP